MKRALRVTSWTLAVVPGLAVVVLGAGLVWLRGSLPDLDGVHEVAGLAAPAEVLRDGDGIVTIRAETEGDAYRALGYVHAQDRLWQMDFMRRTGAGRLSEVVGPQTVEVDRLMRGLGLYRLARGQVALLSPEARGALEAYAEGVNAFLAEPHGPLPPEFQILRYRPEPWTPADSLVWGRLMALQLSNNWPDEILRLELAGRLTEQQIDFLWPDYPADGPVTLSQAQAGGPAWPTDILPWALAPKDASNFWVLDSKRTATGKPILANDPHLALDAPGIWYLVRMETPELTLAGATTPGVPFLVAGHNGRIAWGFTTTHADTQDFFFERLSGTDPDRYETPDGPRAFATRDEAIDVKDAPSVTIEVRETRHGPVLSDLRPSLAAQLPPGQVLALAWPALSEDDRTGEALYRLNRAHDWRTFREALANFHSPVQNVAYADTAGNIGFLTAGRIPLRRTGDGRVPAPGWDGFHDWTGFIPHGDLPQRYNPPDGLIVNANNRVVDGAYEHLITAEWPDSYRARRIGQVLAAAAPFSLEASQALQQDSLSLAAERLVPLLLESVQDPAKPALDLMARWDHRMARDRPEPLIFYAWMTALNERIFKDELGTIFPAFQRANADLLIEALTAQPLWCDDVATGATEDCALQVAAAFDTAIARLEIRYGAEVGDWRWGAAHMANFPHPILRHVPYAEELFGFAVPADGGFYTVNRGGAVMGGADGARFTDRHGPGFRAVYDLADLDNSRFMIATGQSGNPLSALYGSLAERWRDGDYLKLVGGETATKHRLTLNPRYTAN